MTIKEFLRNIFNNEKLNRPDIIVRYLYIEYYYNKNNIGKDLYLKMQRKRINGGDNYINKFNDLIKSFENNGYNNKYKIKIGDDNCLLDGSHRMSCCIYFNILNNELGYIKEDRFVNYNFDWFEKNFNSDEYEIIKNKFKEIKNKLK